MIPTAKSLNEIANDYNAKGDLVAARFHYLAALRIDPTNPPALANLAIIYSHEFKFSAAIAMMERALQVLPYDGTLWNNLGNFLFLDKQFDKARVALNRALELSPGAVHILHNLSLLEHRVQNTEKALKYINRIVNLGHSTPGVLRDRAHMMLRLGEDLNASLEAFESRWTALVHLPPWDYHIPEWKGEDLKGKRILFHAEQGFGDTIMCARFARDLTARGARVVLGVQNCLRDLFLGQDWVEKVASVEQFSETDAKGFDFQAPHYSAMRWLGISWDSIDPRPYIKAPYESRLEVDKSKLNVGICWASGKREQSSDYLRRVSRLEDWLCLAEGRSIQLYSLQCGADREDVERAGADALIIDYSPSFHSWADTAAFIDKLDVVISVDTAVAHLAGAMGKRTYMLSQFTPCWRWQGIESESGLPWYESMTALRQPSSDDWKSLILRCKSDLQGLSHFRQARAA